MELEALVIENFRQFYGHQEIEFSRETDRNVTVIHGSNGSGKTTVLNAFIWLFYDEVNLPRPDQIPSERALAEAGAGGSVDVRVSLTFDHEDRTYMTTREKTYSRGGTGGLSAGVVDENLSVEFVDTDGNHKRRGNPEDSLRSILPERLREIFFFDGETIDELSALGGQEKIQTAIQNIMGLTILERANRHLDTARKHYESQVSEHGSDELAGLYDQRNELESEMENCEAELEEVKSSKTELVDERDSVTERLRELDDSRGLQEERDQLKADVEDREDDINQIETTIAERITEDGHLPFSMPAVEETAQMLRNKREKGEIPSEIKTQFVDDLLEAEECICSRELVPGSSPYRSVEEWREQAGSSELEESAMTIAGRLTEIGEGEEQLFEDIDTHLERRSKKRDAKQQKEERISEIGSLLSDVATEDIAQLEERREELDEQVSECEREIGRLKGRIEELNDEHDDLGDKIVDAEEKNEKADLARRRAQLAEYLQDRVQDLFDRYQNDVREEVNDSVNDIFQDIIAKEFYAEIEEDYTLRILKDVGEEEAVTVAQSTGERQVASLAFIASLVSLAREQYESDEDKTYFTGGIYPMIMDSPFGYLDPKYQERISAMLPDMAHQVVVLVTQSQWTEEVAGEMGRVAGAEYHLEYHDPGESDADYEYTEIVQKGGGY